MLVHRCASAASICSGNVLRRACHASRSHRRLSLIKVIRGRSAYSSAASAQVVQRRARSLLSTTAGTALLAIGGSIIAWPVADACLGPLLVKLGAQAAPESSAPCAASGNAHALAKQVVSSGIHEKTCKITVLSADGNIGKELERIADQLQRPVVYISLRETATPHDLFLSVMAGVYSVGRLGAVGNISHSMGIWWMMVFNFLGNHSMGEAHAVQFSIVLLHLKRALRTFQKSQTSRPIIVLDHFDEITNHPKAQLPHSLGVQAMLRHMMSWCASVCFDEGTADIVLCNESVGSSWLSAGNRQVRQFDNAMAFQATVKRVLP